MGHCHLTYNKRGSIWHATIYGTSTKVHYLISLYSLTLKMGEMLLNMDQSIVISTTSVKINLCKYDFKNY